MVKNNTRQPGASSRGFPPHDHYKLGEDGKYHPATPLPQVPGGEYVSEQAWLIEDGGTSTPDYFQEGKAGSDPSRAIWTRDHMKAYRFATREAAELELKNMYLFRHPTARVCLHIWDHERASPAPVAGGWQPIETAPKDGTAIIGGASVAYVCWWKENRWEFFNDGKGNSYSFAPTHWMPLPAAPAAQGEGVDG